MKHVSVLAVVLSLFVAGCLDADSLVKKPTDGSKPSPSITQPTAEDNWEILAQYVENGLITTPQEIALYVKGLVTNKNLSTDDAVKLDGQFPHAASDTKTLDAKDAAAKLRSIK